MTEKFDIPKLDLLIKLMGLTGSVHDGEALSALRKANATLAAIGKTWEDLLRARITIVADPFTSIPQATSSRFTESTPTTSTSRAYAPPKPPPPPPPWKAPPPIQNKYGGKCSKCNNWVDPLAGEAYQPYQGAKWLTRHLTSAGMTCTPSTPKYAGTSRAAAAMNRRDIDNLL